MLVYCFAVAAMIVAARPPFAQSVEDSEKALHDAQNPIANTISLPFQNNTYFNAGPLEKTANVLVIQPVIPFKLTPEWTW